MTEAATRLSVLPVPRDQVPPVPDAFWDEVATGAPRVWRWTCIAGLSGTAMAFVGDFANLLPEWQTWGIALRLASLAYFVIGLLLSFASKELVRRRYRVLTFGVFAAVAIPVSFNGMWAGDQGGLYWFGILQLQLGASTFFSIPTALYLSGAWGANVFYLFLRLGYGPGPVTNEDINVVIGLAIFGVLASLTHWVVLASRRSNHDQRRRLYLLNTQKAEILSSITDGFFALDRDWRVVFMNEAAEQIVANLPPDRTLRDQTLWEAFPGLSDSLMFDYFHRAVDEQVPVRYEEFYPLLDKEVEVKAFPARDGLSVYFHDVTDLKRSQRALQEARDGLEQRVLERTQALEEAKLHLLAEIDERKTAEAKLVSSLHEKEILLREVHHRSKNNMQVLSSLIRLQAEALQDEHSLFAFHESEQRIRAMALVHEKLYQSDDLGHVDAGAYLSDLVRQLVPAYAKRPVGIDVQADHAALSIDAAIACGLITNELVSNALRHAFEDVASPALQVALRRVEKGSAVDVELVVTDNGHGLPRGVDLDKTAGLGIQLVRALTRNQLGGSVDYVSTPGGLEVHVRFPEKTR